MELLRRVEAEVVHIFVPADAVDVVVELHLGRILAEELDVDLVPRVGLALEVGVVVARAGEEGAGGTRLFGGLHAHFKVAVAEPLVGARLAAEVLVGGLFRTVGVFVDGQLEHVVAEHIVVCIPLRVEHAAVGPAVRRKEGFRLARREVGEHVAVEGGVVQFRLRIRFIRRASGQGQRACGHRQRQREAERGQQFFLHTFLLYFDCHSSAFYTIGTEPTALPRRAAACCLRAFSVHSVHAPKYNKKMPVVNGHSLNCILFTYSVAFAHRRGRTRC